MEEQNKPQEDQTNKSSQALKIMLKVVVGIVFIILGLWTLLGLGWWRHLWTIIKGGIGPFLILAGVITIAIAKD
jgi:hypothetical protein